MTDITLFWIGGFTLFLLGCGAMYAFVLGHKAEHYYRRGHGFIDSFKLAAQEFK